MIENVNMSLHVKCHLLLVKQFHFHLFVTFHSNMKMIVNAGNTEVQTVTNSFY